MCASFVFHAQKILPRESKRVPTLLLVEDNPADAMLLETALNEVSARCRLHLARDGEQAVRYLLHEKPVNRPDLILLDLNLPRMHGHEVLQLIKTNNDLHTIPVVILTSSLAPSDIARAYSSGANSYIQKPPDIDATYDLARTIHHYWLDVVSLPERT
jgi:chemotaxis family two-component system response regulator Rcp1